MVKVLDLIGIPLILTMMQVPDSSLFSTVPDEDEGVGHGHEREKHAQGEVEHEAELGLGDRAQGVAQIEAEREQPVKEGKSTGPKQVHFRIIKKRFNYNNIQSIQVVI